MHLLFIFQYAVGQVKLCPLCVFLILKSRLKEVLLFGIEFPCSWQREKEQ